MASTWELLGSTTLGSAGDQIDVTIAARKYLIIRVHAEGDGAAKLRMRFNDDSGSNYSYRASSNGGSDGNSSSGGDVMDIDNVNLDDGEQAMNELYVINVADKEKICINHHINNGGVGADNAPDRVEQVTKWVNTSAQIIKVSLINPVSGDYAVGSTVTVWGADDQGSTAKDKSTITNVPIGTRYEETDTRTIFHQRNNGLKSSGGAWFEKGNASSGVAGHTYTRGVFGGGYSVTDIMEYITLDTTGDVTDFGDLTVARKLLSGLSSTTRGCFGGGEPSGMTDTIDYITIATTGDAADFGNLVQAKVNTPAPASSATRGLWMGGYAGSNLDEIDYITIATLGNAADFGNLTQARNTPGGLSDDTRACCFGGLVSAYYNIIDYVTIATTGNATDFGDIVTARYGMSGGEDATRGIMAGGKVNTSSTWYDVIEYITIQTLGNATDFGNLSVARAFGTMCSGNTRAVWAGGNESGGNTNVMEYITIQTTGNVTDFGDLSTARADLGACEG